MKKRKKRRLYQRLKTKGSSPKNKRLVILRIIYLGTEPHHSYLFPTRWLDEQRHKLRDRWNFRSVWKAIANRDNWVPVDTYLESSDKGWQLGAHRPFPRKWCSKLHDPPWVDGDDVKLRSRQIIWDKTQRLLDLWDRLYKIDCGVNDCPFVRPFDQTTVKLRRQEAKKEAEYNCRRCVARWMPTYQRQEALRRHSLFQLQKDRAPRERAQEP